MPDFGWIWQWAGIGAAVVSGTTALAYVLFKHFAQGWLDDRFARRLEEMRHTQARDLEAMRYQVSGLLDRTTRLNDTEFKVLPEAWRLLNEALFEALAHVSSAKSYPDLGRMDGEQLIEFLSDSPLLETQKQAIYGTPKRDDAYRAAIYWHRKAAVEDAARAFGRYVEFNGIFLREKDDFRHISTVIWDALGEYSVEEENDFKPRQRVKVKILESEGKRARDALEKKLGDRIWTVDLPA